MAVDEAVPPPLAVEAEGPVPVLKEAEAVDWIDDAAVPTREEDAVWTTVSSMQQHVCGMGIGGGLGCAGSVLHSCGGVRGWRDTIVYASVLCVHVLA